MHRGERMFLFFKQDFSICISMDFPGCSLVCTLWTPVTWQQLHNKAPGKGICSDSAARASTAHTSPVVQ